MKCLKIWLFCVLAACSGGNSEKVVDGGLSPDAAGTEDARRLDADMDVPTLPTLTVQCSLCHDVDALGKAPESSGQAWDSWLAVAGEGLLRTDPAIPEPGPHLGLSWPRRGVHPPSALADGACGGCHPVDEQGIGHGVRAYPDSAAGVAFATGGAACGPGCHLWLSEEVTAAPFGDGGATWQGIPSPAGLLAEGDNAHTALWKEGFSGDGKGLSLKISQFRPGCGGCHNLAEESHGAMLSCLHCHALTGGDGKTHDQHIASINVQKAINDPDGPDSACAYCHMDDDFKTVGKRACYNCHLSGHQPLAPGAGAHFW